MSKENEKFAFARSKRTLRSPLKRSASKVVVNEEEAIQVHQLLAYGVTSVITPSGEGKLGLQKLIQTVPPGKTTTPKRSRNSSGYSHSGNPSP